MISWPSKSTLQRLLDLTDRFALHNIRKIRPFLTEHAAQLLVQALVISRLDYCNALLAGLPSNTIKPLQMIQNAAARLVFNEPKRAHVTPLFISLHWLLVAARIQFKFENFLKRKLKPGIHFVIFALILPWFYSLNKLTLVEESQSPSADRFHRKSRSVLCHRLRLLDSDFDSIQSEDIKHVWYFQSILEHMWLGFICHVSPSNKAHVSAWVRCDRNNCKVW